MTPQDLNTLVAPLWVPTHDCDGCEGGMPGVRAPAEPNGDDNHPFVERCDNCVVYADDVVAAEALAAALGLVVHKRYDDASKKYWRPFLTRAGDPDDHDYIAVDADDFGCCPASEEISA